MFSDWTRVFGGGTGSSLNGSIPGAVFNQSSSTLGGSPADGGFNLFSDQALAAAAGSLGAAGSSLGTAGGSAGSGAFLPSQLMDMSNLDHFQVCSYIIPPPPKEKTIDFVGHCASHGFEYGTKIRVMVEKIS